MGKKTTNIAFAENKGGRGVSAAERALLTLAKKSEPGFSKGLATFGKVLRAVARDADKCRYPSCAADTPDEERRFLAVLAVVEKPFARFHSNVVGWAEGELEIAYEHTSHIDGGLFYRDDDIWQNLCQFNRSYRDFRFGILGNASPYIDWYEEPEEDSVYSHDKATNAAFLQEMVDTFDKLFESYPVTLIAGFEEDGRGYWQNVVAGYQGMLDQWPVLKNSVERGISLYNSKAAPQ